MGNTSRVANKVNIFLLGALFILLISMVVINNRIIENNAPDSSDAIFGGRLESGYEFAGYILSDLGSTLKICSAILVSPNQAVTAAHCLDNDGQKYLGLGSYTADRSQYLGISEVILNPSWLTFNKIQNDIGLIVLEDPVVLDEYAQIVQPSIGCNYVVVGYGKQDNSENFSPLRKSTDVCIESTNYLGNSISFSGREGGLCFGDSGSGIFEAGTNKLITIASSIDSCYINNFAAGAQIFGKVDLSTSAISEQADNKISCGYIDTQPNGVVDSVDLIEFVNHYLEYCNDSGKLDPNLQCGSKDINKNGIVNLEDLALLANLYPDGKCN